MAMPAGGEPNTAAVELSELLARVSRGVGTGEPRPTAGVTPDGRYAFRYDDDGAFWAVRFSLEPSLPFAAVPLRADD